MKSELTIDRRRVMALLGSGSALALPRMGHAAASAVRFEHGVASGDPAADGAVIWTRASTDASGDVALRWTVATGPEGEPVRTGTVLARAAADHTAKVEVDGLEAGREYWYWFEAPGGQRSPVGRFRTLPLGATESVVLAVASCQLYPGGLFNAYADMAVLPRLDAVVHLGDYIYEYGEAGYGAETGRQLGRLPDPPHEILRLADYRRRHAQMKADPDLQAAHARAAFICVWDDHEIANDSWIGGAEEHDPSTEGDWAARKAVAMQAYFEWMPIRDPKPFRAQEAICRSFEFGDLATLAMVETRLLARSRQVAAKNAPRGADALASMLAEREQVERELLGEAQRQWLEDVLTRSVQASKPWQVLGNQVVMARVAGPNLETALGAEKFAATLDRMPENYRLQMRQAIASYSAGVPFNLDSWDGYPHARERLYQSFAKAGARPIVLAGDSHAAWANNLYDNAGRLSAVEVGCTAITSPSYGSLLPGLGTYIAEANREVEFCDQDRKGYSLVTLTPQQVKAEFVAVSTVMAKPFERSIAATFQTAPGRDGGPFVRS